MGSLEYGFAETYSTEREDLSRKFVLVDGDGNILDLSASFAFSDVIVPETRTVNQPVIPFRTVHPQGDSFANPIQATFQLEILSLRKVEIENQISQIRAFWKNAPNQVVDIYWIYESAADPYETGQDAEFYTWLPECSLRGFHPVRSYGEASGGSTIEIDISSPYTAPQKLFPGDATVARIIRGQKLHLALTNNGSIFEAWVRESDGQGLMTLDDQGNLMVLKSIKTHQSLPVIAI